MCLRNCSCTANSYSGGGCLLWYVDLIDLQDTTSSGTGSSSNIISIQRWQCVMAIKVISTVFSLREYEK